MLISNDYDRDKKKNKIKEIKFFGKKILEN